MSILDRYISNEFLRAFFAALTGFLSLYIAVNMLRQGMQDEIPAAYAFQYTMYQIPEIVVMLLPAACLMGTLICLSGMGRRNELIAMHASGISLARIGFIILCLVFIVCCASFMITDRIVPPMAKLRAQFYHNVIQKRSDFRTDIKQSRIWYRSKNLIYNMRAFDQKTNTIQGVSIYTFSDQFHLLQQIDARRAVFNKPDWRLEDGMVTVFEGNPIFPLSKRFSKKVLSLPESPEDFKEIEKEVETLRLQHLWKFIKRNKEVGIDTRSYEVMFWSKISLSLVPLVMALLGIPFATQSARQSSVAKDVSVCFFLIVVYWLFYSTALSVGKQGTLPPVAAAWIPNIVFFIFGIFMIRRGKAFNK